MYMSHTPKELVLSVHALYPPRIGVPYHCIHVAKNITVFTTALGPWYNIKKCLLSKMKNYIYLYTSLHVEMHEFILIVMRTILSSKKLLLAIIP